MSGFDEGAVYYSDQAQFPRGGGGGDETTATHHTTLRKFKEFIRSFQNNQEICTYREALIHNPKLLLIDFEDLDSFDAELPPLLRSSPTEYLPLFEMVAAEVIAGLKSKVAGEETGLLEEPSIGEVQILLTS